MGRLKEEQNLDTTREIKKVNVEELEQLVAQKELQNKEIQEFFVPETKEKKKSIFSKLFKKKEKFDFRDDDSVSLEEALGHKSFDEEVEKEEVAVSEATTEVSAVHKEKKAEAVDLSGDTKIIETVSEGKSKEAESQLWENPVLESLQLEDFEAMKAKARQSLEEKEKQFFAAEAAREAAEKAAAEQGNVTVAVEEETEEEASFAPQSEPVDLLGNRVMELEEEDFQTVELSEIALGEELQRETQPEEIQQESTPKAKPWDKLFKEKITPRAPEAPQLDEITPENLPVPTGEPTEKEVGLIGQGFTSEVYMWDDNRVIKLYKDGFDKQICEKEFHTMEQVYKTIGICPRPYEIIMVDGRIGGVYEYLEGRTMQKELLIKFWSSNSQAKTLAQLHYEMQTQHDFELITVKDKLCNDISMLHELTEREKLKLYKVIKSLPDGNRLCHFDLHPGNVIYKNGVPVIIDWADACIGDPLADVARTSVLLRYGRSKDQPFYVNLGVKIFQNKMVLQYQKEYLLLSRKNAKDIEQWELPIMAARIGEDIAQEEKELLLHYVKRQLQFKSIH